MEVWLDRFHNLHIAGATRSGWQLAIGPLPKGSHGTSNSLLPPRWTRDGWKYKSKYLNFVYRWMLIANDRNLASAPDGWTQASKSFHIAITGQFSAQLPHLNGHVIVSPCTRIYRELPHFHPLSPARHSHVESCQHYPARQARSCQTPPGSSSGFSSPKTRAPAWTPSKGGDGVHFPG